jgi:hypothetical protein
MPEKHLEPPKDTIGFKKMPEYSLSFLVNGKWVRTGLFKREGKEGWSCKLQVTIPSGTYLNLFKVDLTEKDTK